MLALALLVAACDDAEERADKHFQAALTLIEAGDRERAAVEFRNVFRLDPMHAGARRGYAEMLRDAGDYQESVAQFLRLLEQVPDDLEARVAVVEMLSEVGAWDQLAEQVAFGLEKHPQDERLKLYGIIAGYHQAVVAQDSDTADTFARQAADLMDAYADNLVLRGVLIDDATRRGRMDDALFQIDQALAQSPGDQRLLPARLAVLAALGDTFEMENQLRETVAQHPDNEEDWLGLARFLISQEQLDAAEAALRDYVQASSDAVRSNLVLVDFLAKFRGDAVALAELDKLAAAGHTDADILTKRAAIVFDSGDRETAIAQMRSLVAAVPDPTESREIRVSLARMLKLNGDDDEGLKLVEGVIAEDRAHVEARKMQANWAINDDQTGEAIAALRIALEQDPSDPDIYALLARAHERDGNDELVGEMLSLAVSASNSAAEPSLRYGQYLLIRNKLGPAETVLIDALRREPTNSLLLTMLGQTYLQLREWGRMEQVISTLRNFDEPGAAAQADLLMAQMMSQQENAEGAVAFLQGLVAQGREQLFDADAAIVQAYLGRDLPERALQYLTEQTELRPDDLDLMALHAATFATVGDLPKSEEIYRALIERQPTAVRNWNGYYRLLRQMGRAEEAGNVLEQGLSQAENPDTLLWIKASTLEVNGDLAGAAQIYEDMYARNSDNMIIANNLANLLVALDQSPESVGRAFTIARRLASSSLPPYQDTYGWIAVLRGDFAEAIRTLEPAAAVMTEDPMVQYHLARAYQGANLLERAHAQFGVVMSMVGDDDTRDFVEDTRKRLVDLDKDLKEILPDEAEPPVGE